MKTIGVLGGMGAQATMDFEARVHHVAQQTIPPQGNSGYPPMVVYYYRRMPILMRDDRTPVVPLEPQPHFLEVARWLGTRADFLVVAANAPHLFQAQIEKAAGCKVVSMIDATLDEVRRRGWGKVGLLGFGDPQVPVYSQVLREAGLTYEVIDAELQPALNEAVLRVHEGRENDESRRVAREAVEALRIRNIDGIIPGCTEIPILLGAGAEAEDLVNPLQALAEAAVRYAMS